jgi:hypothetical protein
LCMTEFHKIHLQFKNTTGSVTTVR